MQNVPRFIVRNLTAFVLRGLQDMDFVNTDSSVGPGSNILVLGMHILNVPSRTHLMEKYASVAQFDSGVPQSATQQGLFKAAQRQKDWMSSPVKKQKTGLGSKNLTIHVAVPGMLIEGYIVPAETLKMILHNLEGIVPGKLISHLITINPNARFIKVGCADFSVNDCRELIKLHEDISNEL